MKFLKYIVAAILFSFCLFSCKKDPAVRCYSDPRLPALGTYAMTDSVYFLNNFEDTVQYNLIIQLDSLEGDTILLENCFNFFINLKAIYEESTGDFVIFPQPHDEAFVSGSGTIANGEINYAASYSDGGYSFIGSGVSED